jgi:hypothetical protein
VLGWQQCGEPFGLGGRAFVVVDDVAELVPDDLLTAL